MLIGMAPLRKFSESLPMLLLKARETALVRFRPLLRDSGLTEQQWRVLRALQDLGPLTPAGLSRECSILAPSMTRIVRRLADAQMIATKRSDTDQREVHVSITPAGLALMENIGPGMEEQYSIIREHLRPSEYATLTRVLKQLIAIDD
jgi:homoprotocatechuate degradation regulator HpaR